MKTWDFKQKSDMQVFNLTKSLTTRTVIERKSRAILLHANPHGYIHIYYNCIVLVLLFLGSCDYKLCLQGYKDQAFIRKIFLAFHKHAFLYTDSTYKHILCVKHKSISKCVKLSKETAFLGKTNYMYV